MKGEGFATALELGKDGDEHTEVRMTFRLDEEHEV